MGHCALLELIYKRPVGLYSTKRQRPDQIRRNDNVSKGRELVTAIVHVVRRMTRSLCVMIMNRN